MATILVRFGELGLKSEKVRRRFLRQLGDDIESTLMDAGIEHIMDVQRSRVFLELEDLDRASSLLKRVPGIYSFSVVERSDSQRAELMRSLARYGRSRLKKGMSYGLKVKRIGNTDYTSHEIAVEGGGAVMSHLDEGSVNVDLKDPDIWFEVEIRGPKAYLFTERVKGLGGMPASSQGKVVLLLPDLPEGGIIEDNMVRRVQLSEILIRRRGCKVIPISKRACVERWEKALEGSSLGGIGNLSPYDESDEKALQRKIDQIGADGIVYPLELETVDDQRLISERPLVELFPTVSMTDEVVQGWLYKLFK